MNLSLPAAGGSWGYRAKVETFSVAFDSGELTGIRDGNGGSPLLLVHGFTGSKEDFAHDEFGNQVTRLASLGFDVVAMDHRGHGNSGHAPAEGDYSLEIMEADLWSVVDFLGWDRFALLGHSMGGMIAQLMVLARPEQVSQLILLDTHHGAIEDLDAGLVEIGQLLVRTEGIIAVQAALDAFADPDNHPAFERLCRELPAYREWANNKMLDCSDAMYAQMLGVFHSMSDRLEALGSVTVPTLVMVGEHDKGYVAASRRLAFTMPNAELAVIPGAGHSPQFEARDQFETIVDNFLVLNPAVSIDMENAE